MNKKHIVIISVAVIAAIAVLVTAGILLKNLFDSSDKNEKGSVSAITSEKGTDSVISGENDVSSEISSQESSDTVITVGSASASKGETVSVPVSISGNPGIMGLLLEFKYDTAALKYTGYDTGDFLTDYNFSESAGTIKFVDVENDDTSKNGKLFYLKFQVLDSAKSGDAEIKLDYKKDSICNMDEESIPASVENGKVTVK